MNIIQEIRLASRLRPIMTQLSKALHMPFSLNMVITMALLVLQAIIQFTDVIPVPPKYKWVPILAHILAETFLKIQAATHNTDGTPQSTAYTPQDPASK